MPINNDQNKNKNDVRGDINLMLQNSKSNNGKGG
jgi:hypothetical protein